MNNSHPFRRRVLELWKRADRQFYAAYHDIQDDPDRRKARMQRHYDQITRLRPAMEKAGFLS